MALNSWQFSCLSLPSAGRPLHLSAAAMMHRPLVLGSPGHTGACEYSCGHYTFSPCHPSGSRIGLSWCYSPGPLTEWRLRDIQWGEAPAESREGWRVAIFVAAGTTVGNAGAGLGPGSQPCSSGHWKQHLPRRGWPCHYTLCDLRRMLPLEGPPFSYLRMIGG